MSRAIGIALFGGGLAAAAAGGIAWWRSKQTTDAITAAVDAPPVALPPSLDTLAKLPKFNVEATGYWPYSARDDEKKMEGGTKDRLGNPVYTLEQHLAGKAPYVTVSGDPKIFPPGQHLVIDAWPNATFRVTDVGSHFTGSLKVYRVAGREPLDIAVDSSKTIVPKAVSAQIIPGDYFTNKKGLKEVAYSQFKGQDVAIGGPLDLFGIEEG